MTKAEETGMKRRNLKLGMAILMACLCLGACSDQEGSMLVDDRTGTEATESGEPGTKASEGGETGSDASGTEKAEREAELSELEAAGLAAPEAEGEADNEEGDLETNVEVPENEIFLIERYSNMAWGYQDRGYFFDTNGYCYVFDFAKNISAYLREGEEPMSLIEKCELVRETTEGHQIMKPELVKKLYALGMNLSADDEFERVSAACDAGQNTLSFFNAATGEWLKCASSGDWDETSKNPSGEALANLYEDFWEELFLEGESSESIVE